MFNPLNLKKDAQEGFIFDTLRYNQDNQNVENAINSFISETDGNSGADNVNSSGVPGIFGGAARTVQQLLVGIKAYIDTTAQNFVLGQVSDNSITEAKMATDMKKQAGGVAKYDDLVAHTADNTKHIPYVTSTGVANTYAVTLTPAPVAYTDCMPVCVKINVASTGASTLNVNALGAKTIVDSLGNAITSGKLKANTPYTMRYESVSGNFILLGEGGGGTAIANDIRSGKTATVNAGLVTGALDLSSLIASNIRNGITIDSITGVLKPITVVASANQQLSLPTSRATGSTTATKLKEFKINFDGTIRITFTATSSSGSYYTDVRVNDVTYDGQSGWGVVGANALTKDITVKAGDNVELYAYCGTSSSVTITLFAVKCDFVSPSGTIATSLID